MRCSRTPTGMIPLGLILLTLLQPGCGPEPIAPEQATSIPVANPSSNNPLKDVTLENESQHVNKIGGISK